MTVLFVSMSLTAWAETLTGQVVGIADGDTITILDAKNEHHKIRLAGIDAPEKNQPYGQMAKQSLFDQVYDRQVSIETNKRDRYGREIGKVLVNGQDANLVQIQRGLAWHYKAYEQEQEPFDRTTYSNAEIEARGEIRGLWKDSEPIPPWDWRKIKKN